MVHSFSVQEELYGHVSPFLAFPRFSFSSLAQLRCSRRQLQVILSSVFPTRATCPLPERTSRWFSSTRISGAADLHRVAQRVNALQSTETNIPYIGSAALLGGLSPQGRAELFERR